MYRRAPYCESFVDLLKVNDPVSLVGLTAEFPNLGIPTEMAKFCSVFPRKKWLIPVPSDLCGMTVSELWNRTDWNRIQTELCHLNGINIKLIKKCLKSRLFYIF